MRVVVVDDERPCLEELVYLISKQENAEIAGTFTDPTKVLESFNDLQPDIVFLDLVMPHINGIELAREIIKLSPEVKIVFVTAYKRELAHLISSPFSDYLLKPVSEDKLQKVLLNCKTKEI
ncbi:MAG: response regulator [Desulfitobacteriaceae bacterium]|nr:response regulator [Desulfitobacteriaceae bacterium]